jgi:nuclear pore complex protein Nup93
MLLGYGEQHFDGPPGKKSSRRGVWAGVLLMCGQFERVRHFPIFEDDLRKLLTSQAVAALWEHQETEVEAVHLAIALAYHGLLRAPTRAETSEMTPRMNCSCVDA